MVPKGKNVGLDTRGRRAWIKRIILEILAEHGLYENYPSMTAADDEVANNFFNLSPERQQAILDVSISPGYIEAFKKRSEAQDHCRLSQGRELAQIIMTASGQSQDAADLLLDATRVAKMKAIEEVGINHLVSYIFPRIFSGADQDEEHCFSHMTLPFPKDANIVIKAAKPYLKDRQTRDEAIDAGFGAARKRHVASFLYPFMQDCVVGQPGLGRFVRRHMAGSWPDQVAQTIRMRKHAVVKGVLGSRVEDHPKSIAAYYCDTILNDFDRSSFPDELGSMVLEMLAQGEDDNEVRKVIKIFTHAVGEQSISPSIKEFDGVVFEVVPKNSPLVMRAGDINGSCMTLGGIAGECVIDILSNSRAALMVIREPQLKRCSDDPDLFLSLMDEDDMRTFFADRIRTGKMKMRHSLKDEGYIGYCYLRHGLSGNLYVDNIEVNHDTIRSDVATGLVKWVIATMDELGSPRALIGKAYSQNLLGGLGLGDSSIDRKTLMADMPEGSGEYADVCSKVGVWEVVPNQTTPVIAVDSDIEVCHHHPCQPQMD